MKKKMIISIVLIASVILGFCCRNQIMNLKRDLSQGFYTDVDGSNKDDIWLYDSDMPDDVKRNMDVKVKNNEDKDKLITKIFSDGELRVISDANYYDHTQYCFDEIELKYGAECLRKVGSYYYSIHKSYKGGYMYMLYEYDKESNKFKSIDKAFLYKILKKEDFNALKIGKSTLEDVMKIDSEVDRRMNLDRGESIHTLSDGGLVVIKYKNKSRHYVVANISYIKPKSKSVLKIILPKDLPSLNENAPMKPDLDEKTLAIVNKLNNQEDKDKLITKKFKTKDLRKTGDYYQGVLVKNANVNGMALKEISELLGIECLRKNGNYYYSIFKSDEGGYMYVLYDYNTNKKDLYVIDSAYLCKNFKSGDFDTVKSGKSKFKDIQNIDSKAVCLNLQTGPETFILLSNGGYVYITYKIGSEDEIVENIVNYPPKSSKTVLKHVFPKDLPD